MDGSSAISILASVNFVIRVGHGAKWLALTLLSIGFPYVLVIAVDAQGREILWRWYQPLIVGGAVAAAVEFAARRLSKSLKQSMAGALLRHLRRSPENRPSVPVFLLLRSFEDDA